MNELAEKRILEYDLESLKQNIKKCRINIATFEEAIAKENETIKQLRHMISVLEEKNARLEKKQL